RRAAGSRRSAGAVASVHAAIRPTAALATKDLRVTIPAIWLASLGTGLEPAECCPASPGDPSSPPMAHLEYSEIAVPPELARHVRVVWRLRGTAPPGEPEPIVPDGCVELVINFGEPAIETRDGRTFPQPKFMAVGQAFAPTVVQLKGNADMWGVRIQPGAASTLLGASAEDLSQQSWSLDELAPSFAKAFAAIGKLPTADQSDAIVRFLSDAARKAPELPSEVDKLVDYALNGHGPLAVSGMAKWSGINVRRVQRL